MYNSISVRICSHWKRHSTANIENTLMENPRRHGGRVTQICVSKLAIIGSDNGLSPSRRQAIIWTNAGILLIGPLGTNFREILNETRIFSFTKIHPKCRLEMAAILSRPQCVKLSLLQVTYSYLHQMLFLSPWTLSTLSPCPLTMNENRHLDISHPLFACIVSSCPRTLYKEHIYIDIHM